MRYQIENGTVSLGGKTILNHIDFSIKGQEKIAVVGRNGAGKTTLLRLISGELSLDRDDKRFGKGITTDKAISIGFLHQQSFSNAERTVEEAILSLVSEENIFSKERYYFEKEYDRILLDLALKKKINAKKSGSFPVESRLSWHLLSFYYQSQIFCFWTNQQTTWILHQ